MRIARLGLVAIVLLLSGCCIFGATEEGEYVWTSPTLPDSVIASIKRECDAEARRDARSRFLAYLDNLQQECESESPFADHVLVDARTGKELTGAQRERGLATQLGSCRILAETSRPEPEDFGGACHRCRPRVPATDCYSERGLEREMQYRPVCKSMPLF